MATLQNFENAFEKSDLTSNMEHVNDWNKYTWSGNYFEIQICSYTYTKIFENNQRVRTSMEKNVSQIRENI